MSQLAAFLQDPQARLDYRIDWSLWLPEDDAIVASTWTASSVNMTLDDDVFGDTFALVFVAFGIAVLEGETYTATNHITTADGRENDRTLYIKVETQ